ncbi:uncharacterized protein EV420DRAFT_1582871 [Desarmillaria tabescens]|uniref:Uncharacterized protein n=1 Tax=Armillaria tabescens TaxID=1929756 RepID=A0AA39MMS6_ARMTA|nr:uncharacterized protein EV420DRAFT_1582871 [Desarmillaria tabescens]KAK0440012.1 hypothetical protein EV420DRAFT_1582871 [Desarmillaria tabescens]
MLMDQAVYNTTVSTVTTFFVYHHHHHCLFLSLPLRGLFLSSLRLSIMLAFSLVFALLFAFKGVLSHQFYDLASPHLSLVARQATKNLTDLPESSIPSACSANCTQDVLKYLSNCSTSACMCNDQTDQSITSCVDCVVAQGNISTDIGKANMVLTCSKFGVTLASDNCVVLAATVLSCGFLGGRKRLVPFY